MNRCLQWQRSRVSVFDNIRNLFSNRKAERIPELPAEEIIEAVESAAVTCVKASHCSSKEFSKLGGTPSTPPDFEWPVWNSSPLQFLGQIDLSAVQRQSSMDWLPNTGALLFFYDAEQSTWGFDPKDRGSWRVFHYPHLAELSPHSGPLGQLLPERFLSFASAKSYPEPERLGFNITEIPDEFWEYFDSVRPERYPLHQVGGFPFAIQGDGMELECQLASNGLYVGQPDGYNSEQAKQLEGGAADWKLVLQLDTDDDANMMWGDVGRLYFWVRHDEGAKGDFSNVWMILQCS
jgi:uncharacterized protein YwqG